MVRAAALAIFCFAVPAASQTDSPWLNWVVERAPHGIDITHDGEIWINVAPVGQTDDYAIRASDYQTAVEGHGKIHDFWIRGYHKRNPKVAYRESKAYLRIDCENNTLSLLQASYFSADGDQIFQQGYESLGYVTPGTYGAEYHRRICLKL